MNKTSILVTKTHQRLGDFLACCLLLSRYPKITTIHRMVNYDSDHILVGWPGPSNIGDEAMRFTMPGIVPSHLPGTPLGLVLHHLDLYKLATAAWPWLYTLELKETRGLHELADHLNCSLDTVNRLFMPLDAVLLHEFSQYDLLTERHALFQQMIYIGDTLIRQLAAALMVDQWTERHHKILDESGVKFLWVSTTPPEPIEQSVNRLVMQQYRDVAVSVIPDLKGSGWTLFGFKYHHAVDFRKVGNEHEVVFCSREGLLLKTKERGPKDEENIRRLIRMSRIKPR